VDGLSLNSLRMSPAVHPVPGNDRSEVASLPTSNGHPKTLISWLQLWFSDKATWEASAIYYTHFFLGEKNCFITSLNLRLCFTLTSST